jgi:two-component system KDP operon response regulator KdpE
VLVVDDEPGLVEVVTAALRARGHRVVVATTGRAALDAASADPPDVVLLDLGLPDLDGVDVCAHLRRWYRNPIVVLSADGAEDRKVAALDQGADDYITKPFSMPELLARLRVALRHLRASEVADPEVVTVGDLTIDVPARVAVAGGRPLDLTRKEYELLCVLARGSGRVFTHAALLERVWGSPTAGSTESLRVHVTKVRAKLGEGDDRPRLVTEPGVGYRLLRPGT